MVKTDGKVTSKCNAKERRNTLFRVLDGVLSLAHRKIHTPPGSCDRANLIAVGYEYVSTMDNKQIYRKRK